MNRRELLINLKNFCILYGIQGILSEQSYGQAATAKTRLINFVIKYTGGGTDRNGLGNWNFNDVLSPLKPYEADTVIPLGLNCLFNAEMNSHASPQISALSGSLTGAVGTGGEAFPVGNLKNYSTGEGKSIDVLIGEKLQATYRTQVSHIALGNHTQSGERSTTNTSSWGAGGQLIPSIETVNDFSNSLKNRVSCSSTINVAAVTQAYQRKLAALEYIKKNQTVFESKYILDKDKFTNIQEKLQLSKDKYTRDLANVESTGGAPAICGNFPTMTENRQRHSSTEAGINEKMEHMYNLGIVALEQNITRSLTFNLYSTETHHYSHYVQMNSFDNYIAKCRYIQSSIARFLAKLKAAGLYDDSLIFCNAGSCHYNQLHNWENLSAYVINGGKSGVVGSASNRKPVGSILLDILNKFGIPYTEYGGRNHSLGVGRKGNFI